MTAGSSGGGVGWVTAAGVGAAGVGAAGVGAAGVGAAGRGAAGVGAAGVWGSGVGGAGSASVDAGHARWTRNARSANAPASRHLPPHRLARSRTTCGYRIPIRAA
ncbi:MAG: hypothetical protein E6J90_47035 [Deltaproteobacteria bacterium]|nr:MAG: hypothetical protein E6J90_47035 [Deltaproteobacteria bacterium]TMQ11356.1 MAG: hypothetical protein E6J91_23300 [Deltaproteobacteria bacterium]